MPGERVILAGDAGGRIHSFVAALGRFPSHPPWVVVGGFAVNVRISQVHRLTNDLDTISADQDKFMDVLLAQQGADRLGHAKLRFASAIADVDIDVMDEPPSQPLPSERSDRAFAFARRFAMETRDQLTIIVTEGRDAIVETTAPVASVGALVALKSVSMPRRSASNHPEKVASDIHDLVRLVAGRDIDAVARALGDAQPELARWIGQTLVRWFSAHADQRYTLARLRRLSGALDAQNIDEAVLDVLAILGQMVLDGLA
ncbi:MAG: nucleotidyl transferase AbiEii/AbiGii toxin family protein [Acidimicrobiia bacterium]